MAKRTCLKYKANKQNFMSFIDQSLNYNNRSKMFTKAVAAFFALIAILTVQAQLDPNLGEAIKWNLAKSEYVHKAYFKLLWVKALQVTDNQTIPEPMKFDDFTFNHSSLFFISSGTSHTYEPLLYGFSNSELSGDVDYKNQAATINLRIPFVELLGSYDLNITYCNFFTCSDFLGAGSYRHTFSNVNLHIDLEVGRTAGERTIPKNVVTSLNFDQSVLWAENFSEGGVMWDKPKWQVQSAKYKTEWDLNGAEIDLVMSETFESYLGIMWGFLNSTEVEALDWIHDFLNPWQSK